MPQGHVVSLEIFKLAHVIGDIIVITYSELTIVCVELHKFSLSVGTFCTMVVHDICFRVLAVIACSRIW